MKYTFAQAKTRLAGYSGTFGVTNLGDAINSAIQALAGLSGWECLRKVVRYSSAGPCFTLPQGSAGLVRVCVNGRPSSMRGQDFRFIQSGPGDLREPPIGFKPVETRNVIDCGESPLVVEPPCAFRVFAYSDVASSPAITVRGYDESGRVVSCSVSMTASPVYSGSTLVSGTEPDNATSSDTVFRSVLEVTIAAQATGYVELYAEEADTGNRYPIALYHPSVKAPSFRRYSIAGIGPGQPVDILAETRIDPLPLVADSDVLPFDCIEPIEWMINYDWCMKSGEVDKAQKFKAEAMTWLKSKEVVNDTIQTSIVINGRPSGSLGEDSMAAWNI